jgi:hypothetical protein
MNLTEHFTLEELTRSDYAIRHGINNTPTDAEVLENLQILAQGLERIRGLINKPIHVNSGYRSPKVNSAIGGSKTSAHMKGLAADVVIPGMLPVDLCKIIEDHKDLVQFDQLIHEGSWTHIAFPDVDQQPRQQTLTAIFKPGKPVQYVTGIV